MPRNQKRKTFIKGPRVTLQSGRPLGQASATALAAVDADLAAHVANVANPHAVTKAQVGLGNVTNVDHAGALATHTALPNAHKGQKRSIVIDAGDLQFENDAAAPGNNKVYGTDGAGARGWKAEAAGGVPAGSDTHVQFNDAGAFAGDAGLTFNKTTKALLLAGLLNLSGAAAGQIKFPATQNASADGNTLDDCERGDWTPALSFGGLAVGVTYDVAGGKYVKFGRLVIVAARVALTSKGSSAGTAKIGGLPFTIGAGSVFGSGTPVAKFLNMASIANWFSVLSSDGTATIELWNGGAINTSVLTDAHFTNTSDVNFQLAYIAAS